jgi:hypothetical protein
MGQILNAAAMNTTVRVVWEKDSEGRWYAFETDNLDCVFGSGVCVVWYEGQAPAALCVGHGDLPQILHEFCENRAVTMYRKLGALRFTWAEMPTQFQRGAARYLTEELKPVFEDIAALVPRIEINLPE